MARSILWMVRSTTVMAVGMAIGIMICSGALTTAQGAEDKQSKGVEVTLFGGYRFGGALQETQTQTNADGTTSETTGDVRLKQSTAFGVAVNWESGAEPGTFYEVAYRRQSTTLNSNPSMGMTVEYLEVGGYETFTDVSNRVIPYFLLTVGAARYSPDAADLDTLLKPAAAVGAGVKVPLTQHIALRLDTRLYLSFFEGRTDLFCHSRGDVNCQVHLQGGTVLQPDVSLGLAVRF